MYVDIYGILVYCKGFDICIRNLEKKCVYNFSGIIEFLEINLYVGYFYYKYINLCFDV